MEAAKPTKGERILALGSGTAIAHNTVTESLSNKVTFEKDPEGNEGMNQVSMWKKNLPGRQTANAKALR